MSKRKMILIGIIASLFLIMGALIASMTGNTEQLEGSLFRNRQSLSQSINKPYPTTTNPILKRWAACSADLAVMEALEAQGTPTPNRSENYYRCVFELPRLYCGAFEMTNKQDLTSFDQNQDADGDGVADIIEFAMGLNPCNRHSTGGSISDGDLDYDMDGISNKNDSDSTPAYQPNF